MEETRRKEKEGAKMRILTPVEVQESNLYWDRRTVNRAEPEREVALLRQSDLPHMIIGHMDYQRRSEPKEE